MVKKNLIICHNCESEGKKMVLGEIDESGNFAIMRFHSGTTTIIGNDFLVKCGNCGEEVYFRSNNNLEENTCQRKNIISFQ